MNGIQWSAVHPCLHNSIIEAKDSILLFTAHAGTTACHCYALYLCPTLVKQKCLHLQKSHKSQNNHIEVA